MKLKRGVYEHLITRELDNEIHQLSGERLTYIESNIDEAESPSLLTTYLSNIIKERLSDKNLSLQERADLANKIIQMVSAEQDDEIVRKEHILTEIITEDEKTVRNATKQSPMRPLSGFRVSNLFTGGQSKLSLSSEIERDIASADRISLIVSFLKLSGVSLIYDALRKFCEVPEHQLRILTTTYCGVTEAKAVQRLAELPNTEMRISYQTRIERLHAKAYIFERNSGMNTAYIGSSNLSRSAQTDGLEWNIRVTNVENSHIIKSALATFDCYWNSPNFEDYREGGIERFEQQMNLARMGGKKGDAHTFSKYTILPHQKQILDKLQVERENQVMRNLIVAATGTGKTVISAFDYQQFCRVKQPLHKLLFVAHREEILQQAVQTYRNVLQDGNFGDLWVGSSRPNSLEYLFVSVQTFNSRFEDCFAKLSENYYDYIVIDEAHHSTADSYRKILEHFKPQLLLGLTATPERMDGASLLPDFDNRISAEIRLPKALDEGLLTPFQYFCISDSVTDLRDNELMEGRRYVTSKIYDKLCTKQRVGLIVRSLQRYLADEHKCRALCFCADKRQAEYMAKMLREAGLNAACLTSNNSDERKSLNERLASGEINYLCVVDMFNEGVDIPEVDTVLFLRPTESLTIFLQQLGRGLRLSPGKQVLTVLDYVAQLNSKYDYAGRFRRLMVRTDGDLKKQIEQGFTLLPSGCSIHMEEKARQYVLSNINSAIYDKRRLVNELRNYLECPTLSKFIEELDQDVRIVYKGGYCWTRLKRDAGKSAYKDDDITKHLEKGIGNLAHVNTISYLRFIEKVMRKPEDITWVEQREQPYIIMLYYALFQVRIKELDVSSIAEAIAKLQYYPMFVQEIQELVAYLLEHIEQTTYSLDEQLPALLEQYGCYTREEVFTLFGRQTATKKMQGMVSGVFNVEEWNTELLFVTLNKSDVDFSPSTQYDDYVMSETLFHWQSQNTDSHQGTGARFVNQQSNGKRFLLFVREDKKDGYSNTAPFYCFGLVDYVRSYGDKPMNVEWRLHKPVMAKFLKAV